MANLKWSYMDHWSMDSPIGRVNGWASKDYATKYIKQVAGVGFQGIDIFARTLSAAPAMFGSTKEFKKFLQDLGLEKIVGMFHDYRYASPTTAPHIRAAHDYIFRDCERIMQTAEGLEIENLILMPANTYWTVEPVTDEKLHIMADLWNRVGKMSLSHGIKSTFHHEFWCGVRKAEEIEKFYEWTDPQYVYYYCDTAQHTIAGVDPVKLFMKYHSRCTGFHFKDTHDVDTTGQYRVPPDAESQSKTERWFWEMGTPDGLVDFPAMMKALRDYNWRGWVSVEHDKTQDYPDSTCLAKWYVDNVLTKIYA